MTAYIDRAPGVSPPPPRASALQPARKRDLVELGVSVQVLAERDVSLGGHQVRVVFVFERHYDPEG